MKRFRFNLDPALRLRESQEAQAQRLLAESQRALSREEAQLKELQLEMERHQRHRTALQKQQVDLHALLDADRYGEAVLRSSFLQEQRVADAQAAVLRAREQLNQRRIDREALERLRDRRLDEHRQEQLRQEQADLDEAAVLRWKR